MGLLTPGAYSVAVSGETANGLGELNAGFTCPVSHHVCRSTYVVKHFARVALIGT